MAYTQADLEKLDRAIAAASWKSSTTASAFASEAWTNSCRRVCMCPANSTRASGNRASFACVVRGRGCDEIHQKSALWPVTAAALECADEFQLRKR